MNKLTAVKIKYSNGTYSDEIPVSTLAEHIVWDSSHTLIDILGNVKVAKKGDIQQQIDQLSDEKASITQLNNSITNLQNYVDTKIDLEQLKNTVSSDITDWLERTLPSLDNLVEIDDTLSIKGKAADAKVVGDYHMTSTEANLLAAMVENSSQTGYTENIKQAVDEWLTEHSPIDKTLSVEGAAAEAKTTGDALTELNERLTELEGGGTGGLTADIKAALLAAFSHVAWDSDDPTGQSYINALQTALYPPANLSRITAVYTQSGTVWSTDTLDSLKNDLVVTAYYDNSTSEVISNYTLSGTLSEGTRTITVSYGGKTATFNVVVTRADNSIYNWDFTSSLVDSKQDVEAVLTGATRDSNGITFGATTDYISLTDVSAYGTSQFTVEVEFGAFTGVSNTASWPIALGTGTTFGTVCGVRTYTSSWAFVTPGNSRKYFNTVSLDAFNNKTLKFVYDLLGDNVWRVYADGVLLMEDTSPYAGLNNRKYLGIAFLPANSVVKKVRVYAGVV